MVKVKKKSGELVDFELAKLESAIVKAGANRKLAKKIAHSVKVKEGIETANIRAQVITALKAKDPEAAKRYEGFKK
jgi:transcriptional regulator NrdR family protein